MLALETLAAYCRTSYRVDGDAKPFVLRVGRVHPEFDAWLAGHGFQSWAFLTACNPRSQPLDEAENERRHTELQRLLAAQGRRTWPGQGAGDDPGWPPETSVLIGGIDRNEACELARTFGQHAVLVGSFGEPADLEFPFPEETNSSLAAAAGSADETLRWLAARRTEAVAPGTELG